MESKEKYLYVFIALFALFLQACLPTLTPTPTSTSLPTATVTSSPTSTPTITPSPTETPDPNKPIDATGIDPVNGYYIKTESGMNFYWIPIQINTQDTGNGHWFRSIMKDEKPIPLLDYGNNKNEYQKNDLIPLTVYVADNALGGEKLGTLSHQNYPQDADNFINFKNVLDTRLAERYFNTKNPSALTVDQWIEFANGLQDNKSNTVSYRFVTATGTYNWSPSPKTGAQIYIIKWEDADPSIFNDFHESHMPFYPEAPSYRWAIYTDSNGGLVGYVATQDLGSLDDSQFIVLILSPIAEVVLHEQIPEHGNMNYYFDIDVRALLDHANEIDSHTGVPYFIIKK